MVELLEAVDAISAGFTQAGCEAAIHVRALSSGAELGIRPDDSVVTASVFKPLVALEFYAQVEAGEFDPAELIEMKPGFVTPGPTGISRFLHPASVSLLDLAYLMLTVSDNAATDIIIRTVGLPRVNERARACGCEATVIESDLQTMLDGMAAEMGSPSYPELLKAQSGALGEEARLRSTDASRLDSVAALDPRRTIRTTARDMTTFLFAVWADTAGPPKACRSLRSVMSQQVGRRLEPAVPDGGRLAAKSGSLFGRIRNEIAVITYPDGENYAVAVFTRAHRPYVQAAEIISEMGRGVHNAIQCVRARQSAQL
jgi:beta-lactamase class A